jgi:hypothetical protein
MHPCNSTCERFQKISLDVATSIFEATNLGLLFQEETISETSLLAIAKNSRNVRVQSFKRHEEAKNGSDWEWHIRHKKWFRMRIQAKKKRTNGDTFQRLQTYQAKSALISQIDTLIKEAKCDNFFPAYCFYVSDRNSSPNLPNFEGCWIASATKVKSTNSNNWDVLQKISQPWHYLVCNCNSNSAPPNLVSFLEDDEEDTSRYMSETLPDYLIEWSEEKMFARAKKQNLAGFVIIEID